MLLKKIVMNDAGEGMTELTVKLDVKNILLIGITLMALVLVYIGLVVVDQYGGRVLAAVVLMFVSMGWLLLFAAVNADIINRRLGKKIGL